MSSKKIRFGIVGMGIGRQNASGFMADPRGEIAALCDLSEERMQAYAKELPNDVKCYTDYKQMCKDPDIDAIFVGTPNQTHAPIGIEAVKHDKHVMVTKPLAESEKSARKFVEAAEASGVVNMMSLSTRFGADCQYLGNRARAGAFGEMYYARARSVRRSGIPAWNMGFIQAGGGAFRDMGVHVLDAIWYLLGMPEPLTVSGVAGAKFGPRGAGYMGFSQPEKKVYSQYAADDYAGGLIRFEGGIGLQVESFWASHQPEDFQLEIFGTEAGARLKPLEIFRTEGGAPVDESVKLPKNLPSPWAAMATHFMDAIEGKAECQAPLRHGLMVQEMMEALLKSAETGKEVKVKKR